MNSTAIDYARFCQLFLNGGTYAGRRYLAKESIEAATSPQTRVIYDPQQASARESLYGYGWSVSTTGFYSHGGSDGTFAWVDPRRAIVGVVLTQSVGGRNPRDQFRRIVDAACQEDAETKPN